MTCVDIYGAPTAASEKPLSSIAYLIVSRRTILKFINQDKRVIFWKSNEM